MSKSFFRIAILLGFSACLSCANMKIPTRPEFVAGIRKGAFLCERLTLEVKRPLSQVLGDVESRAKRCIAGYVVESYDTYSGGATHGTVTYSYRLKRLGERAEYTVYAKPYPGPITEMPKEGIICFAVDFEAKGSQKTQVEIYRAKTMSESIHPAFLQWIEGKGKEKCPDITTHG